ncbi:hypothetical protein OG601_47095 [Streptomyces sp. NBC_01239]|uniref:hypothetical protein n=1 Tax=Streptomyces sp. NBC_01239 TaxID=2903792 RepID=UPI002255CCEB|nr:hypothetical protein [Streptomyces sp. NBC_01239]MCX4809040.1 hypothetical protein [Streptomyces sp. NBC_01239]MCX4818142.1 hypothetical protein [Streptomyces sp. NBC_01239]
MNTPLTDQQINEIEERATRLYEFGALPDDAEILTGTDVPALLAEVRRLRAELADQADADTVAARATQVISNMGAGVRTANAERNRYRNAWNNARARAVDARADAVFVEQERDKARAHVAELESDAALLSALQAAGVDNWEGYDDALERLAP